MKQLRFKTSGIRQTSLINYKRVLTINKKPEKSLTFGIKRKNGHSGSGRISVRHKGGGHKRKYRLVDFKQDKFNIEGKVVSIEYDPNRSSFIALIYYKDGEKRYILAPQNLKVGDKVITAENAELKIGNRVPLYQIPAGYFVHNVELFPGRGGQLVRAGGTGLKVMAHDSGYTHLSMPSSEIRKVRSECFASIGMISNPEHNLINYGKAGRKRWLGIRPTVRGSVMNPCDHPHGGGEGKTGIGLKYSKTPWGKPARGVKTRKKKNISNKYIIRRRKKR